MLDLSKKPIVLVSSRKSYLQCTLQTCAGWVFEVLQGWKTSRTAPWTALAFKDLSKLQDLLFMVKPFIEKNLHELGN